MDELIRIQRSTVDEHIRAENAHNWPVVYDSSFRTRPQRSMTSFPCTHISPA
jgi:hypothetical protein